MIVVERPSMPAAEERAALAELFRTERARLWNLAYRMTGSGDDADDVVQTAFLRWTERVGCADPLEAPSAWLWRVVVNESIDLLRRRRRLRYAGPWLPAPVDDSTLELALHAVEAEATNARTNPEQRYTLAESATLAFLLALEALGPRQRAALLLCEVFERSAAEAAALLGTTAGNVRILHMRARRRLEVYDRARCIPSPELVRRHHEVLRRFLACLDADDVAGLEALLSEDVHTLTDAGGDYTALTRRVDGRHAVARVYSRAAAHRREGGIRQRIIDANGLPAIWITLDRPVRRQAPRSLICVELGDGDRIRAIHAVLATRKLARFGHIDATANGGPRP